MAYKHGVREDVEMNRKRFLDSVGVAENNCVYMTVTHGDTITVVDGGHKGATIEAEALITEECDVFLFLLTADCLPVVLHDKEHHVLALAHLGWLPTQKHLLEKLVRRLQEEFQTRPNQIEVLIGPCIHKDSYQKNNPEQEMSDEWIPFFEKDSSERTKIDLVVFNRTQLANTGVPHENIRVSKDDTFTSSKYFSHRRSMITGEPEGRFATIAGLV